MFLHNSFSHNRLEQNELDLPQAKFGFWVQTNALRHSTVPVWHSDTNRSRVVRRGPDRRPSAVPVPARWLQLPAMLSSVPRQSRDETNASWAVAFLRQSECSAV